MDVSLLSSKIFSRVDSFTASVWSVLRIISGSFSCRTPTLISPTILLKLSMKDVGSVFPLLGSKGVLLPLFASFVRFFGDCSEFSPHIGFFWVLLYRFNLFLSDLFWSEALFNERFVPFSGSSAESKLQIWGFWGFCSLCVSTSSSLVSFSHRMFVILYVAAYFHDDFVLYRLWEVFLILISII